MSSKIPFTFNGWLKLAACNFCFGIAIVLLVLKAIDIKHHTGTEPRLVMMVLFIFLLSFVFTQLLNLLHLFMRGTLLHIVPLFLLIIATLFGYGELDVFLITFGMATGNYLFTMLLAKK